MNSQILDSITEIELIIEFERCSIKDLECILEILYNSSTLCHKDIVQMATEIIIRLDEINYNIREKKYGNFIHFVHRLFKVLGKIGNVEERVQIHDKYNKYYKNSPISPVSSPKTPPSVSPPKIMKKPAKLSNIKVPKLPFTKN